MNAISPNGWSEAAEAIVLVRDLEGRIVLYNPYMEKISGLPLAETKGKNWFSTFLPAPERQRAREVFIQTLCDGEAKAYFGSLLTRRGLEPRDRVAYPCPARRQGKRVRRPVDRPGHHRAAQRRASSRRAVRRDSRARRGRLLTGATPRLLEAICMAAGWISARSLYVDSETQTLRLDGL